MCYNKTNNNYIISIYGEMDLSMRDITDFFLVSNSLLFTNLYLYVALCM